jgi:hypothetical protein
MEKPNRQAGLTFVGWMIVLGLILFFMLMGFRLFPLYYEAYAVGRTLHEVADDPSISPRNRAEVFESIQKRFNINQITAVEPEDLEINQAGNGFEYVMKYEQRTPFLGNLYLLAEFHKKAKVSQ